MKTFVWLISLKTITDDFSYQFTLESTVDEGFVFYSENITPDGEKQQKLGGGQTETSLVKPSALRRTALSAIKVLRDS